MSKKKDGKSKGSGSKKLMTAVVAIAVLLAGGYFALGAYRPAALEALAAGRVADAFHLVVGG